MSVHIHECTRPSDDDYCASRGYCECECGAWQGEANDEWFLPVRESLPKITPGPDKLADRLVKAVWTRSELLPDDPAEYQDFATEEVAIARRILLEQFEAHRHTCAGAGCGWYKTTVQLRSELASLKSEIERLRETALTDTEADTLLAATDGMPEELNDKLITIVERASALRRLASSTQKEE